MYLDAEVQHSHYGWLFILLFLLIVLGLAVFAQLSWWQYVLLVLMVVICLFWRRQPALTALSVKQPNELWQLGIDGELWQGYLNQAELMDVGITKAIKLSFYIVEPYQQPYTVLIFRSMLDEANFRRLTTLVRVGGYRSSEPA